jgi:hypothetical protein
MQYAKHEAELNTPDKDGVTLRAHLEERQRRGLPTPELDSPPELPEELSMLYGFALELRGRSGVGQYGYAPLSYSTIADWSHLTGWRLEPREVEALVRIDSALDYRPPSESEKPEIKEPVKIAPWPQRKKADG